jgi:hypothetical protein
MPNAEEGIMKWNFVKLPLCRWQGKNFPSAGGKVRNYPSTRSTIRMVTENHSWGRGDKMS